MNLSVAIQEALLALVCYCPISARQAIALVPADCYDSYYRDLALLAEQYLQRYQQPAGEHTLDLVDTLKKRNADAAPIYQRIYDSLEQTRIAINRDYVLSQATLFARYQRMRRGMGVALQGLERGDELGVVEAEQALAASLQQTYDLFRPGIDLRNPEQALRFLDQQHSAFPTGIPQIDARGLGPTRKRLHVFMAPQGSGKSWWLIWLAKQALLARLRVVYITLELDENEVAQRALQALFSVTKRKVKLTRRAFQRDELGRFVDMDEVDIPKRPALADDDIRQRLTKRIGSIKHRPPLIIREFPSGSLTLKELDAYLDSLEGSHRIIPDLVLLDYAALMTLDPADYRRSLGQTYVGLRGIAGKRNLGLATVHQTNRAGGDAKLITAKHTSEDFSVNMTADSVLTYNQTPDEHELGLARLFQAKGRTDEDKFTVLISQAYGIGQFCMDSVGMLSSYWKHIDAPHNDREDDDDD